MIRCKSERELAFVVVAAWLSLRRWNRVCYSEPPGTSTSTGSDTDHMQQSQHSCCCHCYVTGFIVNTRARVSGLLRITSKHRYGEASGDHSELSGTQAASFSRITGETECLRWLHSKASTMCCEARRGCCWRSTTRFTGPVGCRGDHTGYRRQTRRHVNSSEALFEIAGSPVSRSLVGTLSMAVPAPYGIRERCCHLPLARRHQDPSHT